MTSSTRWTSASFSTSWPCPSEKHFTRAAKECHVTPTLSGRIRQLEQELGVPIVERGQRFHGFTPEGDRVLTWANAILDNWDEPIETNSVINLCANVRLSGLASVIPEYFLDVLGPISDVRAVPLSSPIVEHSVGLIAVDRDPISPLVLAAFECARAIDRRL